MLLPEFSISPSGSYENHCEADKISTSCEPQVVVHYPLSVLIRFISEFFSFVQRHPECIKWLIALGACSAFGQYFIFSIVTTFGPLWCSIVTTTRKFFTILFSVMYFGNALSSQQWAGSLLVFAGLALDGYLSTRQTQTQPQTKQQPRKKAE